MRAVVPRLKRHRSGRAAPQAVVTLSIAIAVAGCSPGDEAAALEPPVSAIVQARAQTAVFAGGCFWSVERHFERIPGVISAVSGFTGGRLANPTYDAVVRGGAGHLEAVRVTFDPQRVTYRALVDGFWRSIDPTDPDGQFCDQGDSYATAVFATPSQRPIAEASRAQAVAALGGRGRFVTPVRAATRFWSAGSEHQDYWRRQPTRYEAYARGCRRAQRLTQVWGR